MNYKDYNADPNSLDKQQGNPSVSCNAIYKTETSFNCYLTPSDAIEFARNLLQKAQLILDEGIDDAVVHVWNSGKNKKLSCGTNKKVSAK
jgi:hypothetical protein